MKTFTDYKGWVTAAAFSPDGKWFATAGADEQVIVWDAEQLKKVTTLPGFQGVVREIAFSADGKYLMAPGEGELRNIWAVGQWQKIRTIRIGESPGAFFLLTPDGRTVITPGWTTYDMETGQASTPEGAKGWSWAVLALDASRMVSVGSGGTVAFWDMRRFWTSLEPLFLFSARLHQDHGRAVAYSPDGRLVASGAEDILLWDALKMTKIDRLKYPANVMGLAFSPDNRHLVSTHADGAILCWNVSERELQASFNEHIANLALQLANLFLMMQYF
ncbi:MAG TPA: hypothetical protein VJ810_14050 [Blastocatellia bacterium]|nr:hypothetical protein [Blastocatellia bacterium]